MIDLTLAANVASVTGIPINTVFKVLVKTAGKNFKSERQKKINEYMNEISLRMEYAKKILKNGFQDKLLEKYYNNDKSNTFELYKSLIKEIGKCGFAYYKPFSDHYTDKGEFCNLDNGQTFFKFHNKWSVKLLRLEEDKIERLSKKETRAFNDSCKLEVFKAQKIKIWDNPIYVLKSIDIQNGSLTIDLSTSTYLKHRFNFGEIQDELLGYISKELNQRKAFVDILNNLFVDNKLYIRDSHGRTLDDFGNTKNRIVPIGINVLVALRNKKNYSLIIQNRSHKVAELPYGISVIPAAIHQPVIDAVAEKSILSTMWREIYEELLGGEEVTEGTQHIVPEWYLKESDVMKEMVNSADAYCLGCGLNLLNGFFDFSILLKINTENVIKNHSYKIKTNWEIAQSGAPIFSSRNKTVIRRILKRKDWLPVSRFTFEKGMILLNKLDPNRCLNIKDHYFCQ